MDFITVLKEKTEECNALLNSFFINLKSNDTDIYESMIYSIKSGGKRLRMIVLLECAKLFTENIRNCIPFACAVEMIHTYSLIHDDLPSLDNADYRRGNLSNHKVFGESMAILAGDGLLNYAFEVMLSSSLKDKDNAYIFLKAINEIAHYSGINGMILGQSIDTHPKKDIDLDLLMKINDKKTASMFIGPMKAGAIIAGASNEQIEIVSLFAYNLGMAFQITDDILDIIGDFNLLGKDILNDQSNDKKTVASVMGIGNAYQLSLEHLNKAKVLITKLDTNCFFTRLCDYLVDRNS